MKIEFGERIPAPTPDVTKAFQKGGCLLLGILSLIIAFVMVPIGFLINLSIDIFDQLLIEKLSHYITVVVTGCALMGIISVVLGTFSIISFTKSKKQTQDLMGVTLSVIAFLLSLTAFALTMLGIFVW